VSNCSALPVFQQYPAQTGNSVSDFRFPAGCFSFSSDCGPSPVVAKTGSHDPKR
jgi:hypothetical protein